MPTPVSRTAIRTKAPSMPVTSSRSAISLGSAFLVSIVSLPPLGIASRAFTARLSSI